MNRLTELNGLNRRHFTALAALGWLGGVDRCAQAAPPPAPPPVVLVLGDSLSAEYGLPRGTGWVSLLETLATQEKRPIQAVNASISGDTTSGGRSRLPALLAQHRPAVVVIELGANDALRGLPLSQTRDHLSAMARTARQAGAQVLLVGMQIPPNFGARYANEFAQLYTEVARVERAALLPFLLRGVADSPNASQLFQADRLHPNEQAQPRIRDNVWPELRKLLPRR